MGTLPVMMQERFEEKWNNTVVPKLAEDEAACRADEANMRRRIAEVGSALPWRGVHHGKYACVSCMAAGHLPTSFCQLPFLVVQHRTAGSLVTGV